MTDYKNGGYLYGADNSKKVITFNKWITEVQADAWERGHYSACGLSKRMCREKHANPHREEN